MAKVTKRHREQAARQYYGDVDGWERSARVVSFVETGASRYRLLNEIAAAFAESEKQTRAAIVAWLRLRGAATLAGQIERGEDVRPVESANA